MLTERKKENSLWFHSSEMPSVTFWWFSSFLVYSSALFFFTSWEWSVSPRSHPLLKLAYHMWHPCQDWLISLPHAGIGASLAKEWTSDPAFGVGEVFLSQKLWSFLFIQFHATVPSTHPLPP